MGLACMMVEPFTTATAYLWQLELRGFCAAAGANGARRCVDHSQR
eukprot:COSAG06_NODE_118_length_23136_cov_18.029257_8_plen_45_part_00